MPAGTYNIRIMFEQDVGTKDTAGQHIPDWQPFNPPLKRWGKRIEGRESRGRAYWAAQQEQAEVSGIIEVLYDSALHSLLKADRTKIRGKIGDSVLYIEAFDGPKNKGRTLDLIVREPQ